MEGKIFTPFVIYVEMTSVAVCARASGGAEDERKTRGDRLRGRERERGIMSEGTPTV